MNQHLIYLYHVSRVSPSPKVILSPRQEDDTYQMTRIDVHPGATSMPYPDHQESSSQSRVHIKRRLLGLVLRLKALDKVLDFTVNRDENMFDTSISYTTASFTLKLFGLSLDLPFLLRLSRFYYFLFSFSIFVIILPCMCSALTQLKPIVLLFKFLSLFISCSIDALSFIILLCSYLRASRKNGDDLTGTLKASL